MTDHLDLPSASVTRVDLDAQVPFRQQGAVILVPGKWDPDGLLVRADVGLDTLEQVGRTRRDRTMMVHPTRPGPEEHKLHLAAVATPRGEQPVTRLARGRVLAPAHCSEWCESEL